MRKLFFIQWLVIVLMLSMFHATARAQTDPPVMQVIDGSAVSFTTGAECTVQDDKFFDPAYTGKIASGYSVQNIVSLELNEGLPIRMQSDFDILVGLTLYKTAANGTVTTETRTLNINYRANASYNYRDYVVINNAFRLRVVISSVTYNNPAPSWAATKTVKIVNQLQSFPRYNFSRTTNTISQVSDSAWAANTNRDDLPVWWTPSIGADEYDLEWTYIDKTALDGGRYGTPSAPNLTQIFENNATRVSIVATAYRIPIIYDKEGTLFYRVRAVQTQPGAGRNEAVWTTTSTAAHGKFAFNGHADSLNWQATTSFAEEGKRKTVVQYYDGSLRGRQTVTKDNTVNRTVVAESFYDYQGRPVIQALPAPTTKTIIGYTPGFNKGFGVNEYEKSLFDSLANPGLYCSLQAQPMDSVSGASQYYSSLSAFKDSGVHKYVPNAGAFPFTETEYAQDNTGRITRQGGVGKDFRLGSGHETKYYYSTADQRELDALFGTEVGDASHYFKNTVKDANGQYSISYVDMHGRTIATALAGTPDSAKLDKLASNYKAKRIETISTPSSVILRDLVMEHKKSLSVTTADFHEFFYSLSPQIFTDTACKTLKPICYDCLYDLEITISDDCNNMKIGVDGQPFTKVYRNFSLNNIDTTCNTGTGFNTSFSIWLPEGNYEVTKKLIVSSYGMNYLRDSIFMKLNTCKTLEEFKQEQRAILAQVQQCQPTCKSCQDSVGTWEQYWLRFRTSNGITAVDSAAYRSMAVEAWEEATQECAELCATPGEDISIRKAMLNDMTPASGQYANLSNENDIYSIFYSRTDSLSEDRSKDTIAKYTLITNYVDGDGKQDWVFDEEIGKLVKPQELTPAAFAQRFKASWAESLLPKHPEYCKLQNFELLASSHAYDKLFEETDTYAEAKAKGYLNPTNDATVSAWFGGDDSKRDPFFTLQSNAFNAIKDSLTNFRKIRLPKTQNEKFLSLWSFATMTVMCPDQNATESCYLLYDTYAESFNTGTMCTAELDMAWRTFRQAYLNIKRNMINKWLKGKCPTSMTTAQILASGHSPHFTDASELQSQQKQEDMPASEAEAAALVQKSYEDNCKAYTLLWIDQLGDCYHPDSLNNVIFPALINICKEGADTNHPYGSSSVKPSSTATYRSFDEYIKYYNRTHNISDSVNCNAFKLTAPLPYDQQAVPGNKPLYSKPDTCECSNVTRMFTKYLPKKAKYNNSFSTYLKQVYQTNVSDSVLNLLLSFCQQSGFPVPECDLVSQPIYLPPVFQCNTNDVCVDCEKFKKLDAEFKVSFPTVHPAAVDTAITDSVHYRANLLYEQFMNHKLGYSLVADDYLSFKTQCGSAVTTCDSLKILLDSFYTRRHNLYGVTTKFFTEYDSYTDFHDIVRNGVASLPDSDQLKNISSGFEMRSKYGAFCGAGGYSIETKIRFTSGVGHFYVNLGPAGATFRPAPTSSSYGPAGLYLVNFNDDKQIYYGEDLPTGAVTGPALFDHIWVKDIDMSQWMKIKIKVTQTHNYLYFDDRLILTVPRDSTQSISNFSAAGIGIGSTKANIDYWKIFDGNGKLYYFEDFLDVNHPVLPDQSYICLPSNYFTDCQTDFTNYYNEKYGTNYSSNQIDSIFIAQCGQLPDPCHDRVEEMDNLLDSFTTFRKTTLPYVQYGTSDGQIFKGKDIYQNGLIMLPDSIRQIPSNWYNNAQFGMGGATFCWQNGYSIETKIKFLQKTGPGSAFGMNAWNFNFYVQVYTQTFTSAGTTYAPGLYLYKFDDRYEKHYGNANGSVYFDHILVDSDTNAMFNWSTFKAETQPTFYSIRYNGREIIRIPRNPDSVIQATPVSVFAFSGRQGTMDWIKMYDANGTVKYFEDFIDPDKPAGVDPSFVCPAGAIPSCQALFTYYYNQKYTTSYTFNQIDSIYRVTTGKYLSICADSTPSSNKLDQLLTEFKQERVNPSTRYVDLYMRTLAGDQTPREGPKGVFDVNENLIGNTVDGTIVQVDSSFATIWNSSPTNQAVGTLYPLTNGQFRLFLKEDQTTPCNGIIGMRYFQFEAVDDTLSALRIGTGCYVDFGDGIKTRIKVMNDGITSVYRYRGPGGSSVKFCDNLTPHWGYGIGHKYQQEIDHTVTVYHSDKRTQELYLDCSKCNNITKLKNLRGYAPAGLVVAGFHSTQDSTFNTTANLRNFSEINTIEHLNYMNGSVVPNNTTDFLNNRFSSFANNRNMRALWFINTYTVPTSQLRKINEYMPNLPANFPNLSYILMNPFDSIVGKDVDFRLPRLRGLSITGNGSLTAAQVDNILHQVATTTLVDSGAIGIANATRTSASNADVNALVARKWYLAIGGVESGSAATVVNYPVAVPRTDSIAYANEFSDFINSRLGTNMDLLEVINLYQTNLGYQPDYCSTTAPALTLCGRAQPIYPVEAFDAIDNCSDSTLFIESKAADLYQRYTDSLRNNFDSAYQAKCMQAYNYERFIVRHDVSEYHYTLYYYDQAGNLVKTISPEGVKPNYDSLWLDQVAAARTARQIKVPAHALPTQYRYNTLNQVTAQKSPDGGKTEFWYDRLGRLVISRNARQLAMSDASNKYYSYTRYDQLGRITEVGQVKDAANQTINDAFTRNNGQLDSWFTTQLPNREQVTSTIYDLAYDFSAFAPKATIAQKNLRNRVSYVSYAEVPGLTSNWNHASFYSYDIHGNVDTLLQDYGRTDVLPNVMNKNGNRWKKFVYEYDLISGKVNKVTYQPGYNDQWSHRYYYDAENRLTEVYTSIYEKTWEREAKYEYYLHGPLARTTLGQQQVQGIDYAYTLQGWLKGMNSTGATSTHDIGQDALAGSLNQYVAGDAMSFTLNYFGGEYKPIHPGVNPFPAYAKLSTGGVPDSLYRPLYNGNISSMATYIKGFENNGIGASSFYNYKYDQLNRLTRQDVFTNFDRSTNSYSSLNVTGTSYRERVAYDANGNITGYLRHSVGYDSEMDSLNYKYYPGTNQLRQVRDRVADTKYPINEYDQIADIDNQSDTSNYVYDEIGNLIQDKSEGNTQIKWNVYGKITEVTRTPGGRTYYSKIVYGYDAQGNRISKIADKNDGNREYTWYVRDAQGNLMSTYGTSGSTSTALDALYLEQKEKFIFGSGRLGVQTDAAAADNSNAGPQEHEFYSTKKDTRGWRQYELSNHLGNVLSTISDKKNGVYSTGSLTLPGGDIVQAYDYYNPEIISSNDYYPFGMPSRINFSTTGRYNRFGFNGQENDFEAKGWMNQVNFAHRVHDPRIGRFLSMDPIAPKYPYNSPYAFAENKVIAGKELEGLEVIFFAQTPPWANLALESNNVISRAAPLAEQMPVKNIVESSVETGVARPNPGSSWFRWLRFGREVHKEELARWATEEGFDTEVPLGQGNRIDGVKIEQVGDAMKGILRELKPNSQFGRKAGVEQLMRYLEAAKQKFPDVKEWSLELFKYNSITGVNYTVQSGDNLSGIAKKFGITTGQLMLLNNIQDQNKVKAGENLLVGIEIKKDESKSKPLSEEEKKVLGQFIKNIQQKDKKEE